MSDDFRIYIGSIGSGVLVSEDSGRSFTQMKFNMPIPPWGPWIDIRAVEVSPHDHRTILAGSHVGLHISQDGGRTFEFISTPFNNKQVWSIAWHPTDANHILVGTAGWDTDYPIFRTRDGGVTWQQLSAYVPRFTPPVGASHITKIVFDPSDHNSIWAGAEIYGVVYSRDGGESWSKVPAFGDHAIHGDVHGVAVHPGGKVFASIALGLFISEDRGETFVRHNFPDIFPVKGDSWNRANALLKEQLGMTQYNRHVTLHPTNPDIVYVGTGDTTPGTIGLIQRSRDGGGSWEPRDMPARVNSHMNSVAVCRDVPDVVVATSLYGQVFVSLDAGDTWKKCEYEFGEIRGLAVGV